MLRKVVLLTLTLMALVAIPVALADTANNANSHVYVNVDPNIAISPQYASVNLGAVQTGTFNGAVGFRVDANTEKVKFMAGVSNLYKGDNPSDSTVAPILIDTKPGVGMAAERGNPTSGHLPSAQYLVYSTIAGYPGQQTEWVTFESSQNNHFSQMFTLTPGWNQTDPEKPMGEYSGVVALWAMVVLP